MEIPDTMIWIIKNSRRLLIESFEAWLETNKEVIGDKWYASLNKQDWKSCDTISSIMGIGMWMFNSIANLGVLAGMNPGGYQIHQLAEGLDEKTTRKLLMAISNTLTLQYFPRDMFKDFKLPIISKTKFSLQAYIEMNNP